MKPGAKSALSGSNKPAEKPAVRKDGKGKQKQQTSVAPKLVAAKPSRRQTSNNSNSARAKERETEKAGVADRTAAAEAKAQQSQLREREQNSVDQIQTRCMDTAIQKDTKFSTASTQY
eukprot:SAG11_NODE_24639_length_370_cov_0.955720_1_plen_117_part_10